MRGVEAKLQEDPAALVIGTGGQPVLEHIGRPRLIGRRGRALGHKKSPPSGLDYSTEGGTGQGGNAVLDEEAWLEAMGLTGGQEKDYARWRQKMARRENALLAAKWLLGFAVAAWAIYMSLFG